MKEIIFAGGCFWGVEEYFSRIEGVHDTEVGYANGLTQDPDYKEVCTGKTGYAEACRIKYDPDIITLETLLDKLFEVIDPTLIDRQGPDIGNQYRTGVYYVKEEDRPLIEAYFEKVSSNYDLPIRTELEPLKNFVDAEDYHQDYLKKNPGGYCHIKLD
jgi:peptide-methionine (S)-S-oxide reductase